MSSIGTEEVSICS